MAKIVLKGDSSGSIDLTVPAVAGSHVITFPSATGDVLLTTVVMNFPTNLGSSGDVLITDGAGNLSWGSVAGTGTVTSVDVSGGSTGLTFNGGPITGSGTITAGGVLGPAYGGTGANTSSASNGQLLIGNGSGFTLSTLSAGSGISITNTSGGITITNIGGGGGPTTPAGLNTEVQYNNSGVFGASAGFTYSEGFGSVLSIGNFGGRSGSIRLQNVSSATGNVGISVDPGATTSWTLVLPSNAGANGQVLSTDGFGVTSWSTVSSGSGTVNSGTAGQITYYAASGSAVSGTTNAAISGGHLTLGSSGSSAGSISLAGSTNGSVTIDTATSAGTWTLTLPTSAGTSNQVLQTDGSGNTSWVNMSSGGTPGGSNTQVQYNNSGSFAGDSSFTYNGSGAIYLGSLGSSSGTITLYGASSGSVSVMAAAAAGNNTATFPAKTGNVMIDGPAFSAYATGSQTMAANTFVKITLGAKNFDTAGNFSGSRFTCTVAGYYQFSAGILYNGNTSSRYCNALLYKNGTNVRSATFKCYDPTNPNAQSAVVSALIQMNVGDYIELYGITGSVTVSTTVFPQSTFLTGSLVRGV